MDGEEPLRPILQEKKSQPRKILTRKRRRPFGRGEEVHLDFMSWYELSYKGKREKDSYYWHSQILKKCKRVKMEKLCEGTVYGWYEG